MIDEKVINEIRNSTDIVNVISSYINLIPKGKNFFGVCPFHDDNNPSLSVSKEKQIYRCFSCGASGNVFKFIMDYENIGFKEAVKKCADIAGIPLTIDKTSTKSTANKDLYEMYSLSNKIYQNNLMSKDGNKARLYLEKRGITEDIIKTFKIGLSLDQATIKEVLINKKYKLDDIVKSGLVVKNELGITDIYKNRIMFPLFDLNDNIVGYSGRVYDKTDSSKYINTKETEIFKKGEILYNYVNAKEPCRKANKVIVVEGFMDVIALYKVGIKNVVALMGTALTKNQMLLIKKMAREVILCFDGDEAGQRANYACANEFIKVGVTPKIIRLTVGLDPDEYINKHGGDEFTHLIENSLNIMDFKLEYLKDNKNLNNASELSEYINEVIKSLNEINDDILKEITIKKISDLYNIDLKVLKDKLIKKEIVKTIVIPNTKEDKYQKAEKYLIYYMLRYKEVIKMYNKRITYMPTSKYRNLARLISIFYDNNNYINEADLMTQLCDDEELTKVFEEIEALNLNDNYTKEEIDDYIKLIQEYNVNLRIKDLENKLKQSTDDKTKLNLLNEILKLRKGDSND